MNPIPTTWLNLLRVLFGVVILFAATNGKATVTLEIYFEDGTIIDGSLAAIVADMSNDGFFPLTDPSVSGTLVEVGATIGESDDRIIATFNASGGAEWTSGAGIAETLPSLNYEALGLSEGTPLVIYVFPFLEQPGSRFILGDEFVAYRNTASGDSGGDIAFEAPADPGVYTIAALTSGAGGVFDPENPVSGETYFSGNAGATGGNGPGDESSSRNHARVLAPGSAPGVLTEGDIDFFRFSISERLMLSASLNTDLLAQAWIFDEQGNEIYSPREGDFSDYRKILDPGTYFVALRESAGTESGSYRLDFAHREVILTRPDLTIGKSPTDQKGAAFFSPSGSGQRYVAKSRNGKKVRSFFHLENRGDLEGMLMLRGSSGTRFHKLKYLSMSGAGNVTASVRRGGFEESYPPEKRNLYRLDVRTTRDGKARKKGGKFTILSEGEGGIDCGKLRVKFLKQEGVPGAVAGNLR